MVPRPQVESAHDLDAEFGYNLRTADESTGKGAYLRACEEHTPPIAPVSVFVDSIDRTSVGLVCAL